jgi:hypothetical protein
MEMGVPVADRKPVGDFLAQLERMPAFLEEAARRLGDERARAKPARGGFSLVEHAWHLADLEREGYAERILRLCRESVPSLPDFEGDRIARERRYQTRSLGEGLAAFAAARRGTLALLGSVHGDEWERAGDQEGLGRVTLRDVPCLMAGHDEAHRREIAALLAELRP